MLQYNKVYKQPFAHAANALITIHVLTMQGHGIIQNRTLHLMQHYA